MFEGLTTFFKKIIKQKQDGKDVSKNAAKERLHLVLMQDRANVSADFLDLMKQEIIEVIKKYIEIDEKEIDVRLTNQANDDGTTGAPALYANIPIVNIKNDVKNEQVVEKANSTEEHENTQNNEPKVAEMLVKNEEQKNDIKQEVDKQEEEKEVVIKDEDVDNKNVEQEIDEKEDVEIDTTNVTQSVVQGS